MYDVFLSYAREDDPGYTEELHSALEVAGLRVWWDRASMPSRALTFHYEIRSAIDQSERLLLVLGPDAASSEYVKSEWQYALARGKAVTAVIRRGGMEVIPPELKNLHAVDGQHDESKSEAFGELIRLLREPVPPLAPAIDVPELPPHFLPRTDIIAAVCDTLLIDRRRPDQAASGPRSLVLHGMSGSGKSVMAAAFAAMIEARRAFPDAVIWIKCGPGPDNNSAMRRIHRQLRPGVPVPENARELANGLKDTLSDRSVLIVLDDVRDADDASLFLSSIGPGCRILITALDGGIATTLGASELRVDVLTAAQSATQLQDWVASQTLPPEAADVVAESGGLPFALAIIGAMAADGQSWNEILTLLHERDLDLVKRKFPGYEHPHLLRALDAGVEALRQAEPLAADLYLDLAVFRAGIVVPEAAVLRFWRRRSGLSENRGRLVFPILERRSLIGVEKTASGRQIRLHNLHEDYLRIVATDLLQLHGQLLDAYKAGSADGWATGPDDGYYFDNLSFHLEQAGRKEELFGLVDRPWIERQLERSWSHRATVTDLHVALNAAAQEPVHLASFARCCLLESVIRTSSVASDPADESMIGLFALTQQFETALARASLQRDETRFRAYLLIAKSLTDHGEVQRARSVLAEAAALIAQLGQLVHTGFIPDLTQLNAVHALVAFPGSDQWEGTTEEMVALARIPLDAVLELIPLLAGANSLDLLNSIQHPFWGFYYCLIARVAAERLALDGRKELARSTLEALRFPDVSKQGLTDVDHAASYRDAVAWAALSEHQRAIRMIDDIPNRQYRSVGYHRVAVHAATAGNTALALTLLASIDDPVEKDEALKRIASAYIQSPEPTSLSALTDQLVAAGYGGIVPLARAAAGEIDNALADADALDDVFQRARLRIAIADTAVKTSQLAAARRIAEELIVEITRGAGAQWVLAPFVGAKTSEIQRTATLDLMQVLLAIDRWNVCLESLSAVPVPARWTVAIHLGGFLGFRGRLDKVLELAGQIEELPFRVLVVAKAILAMKPSQTDQGAAKAAMDQLLAWHAQLPPEEAAPVPLDRFLPVALSTGLHDQALRIVDRLGNPDRFAGVRIQVALQRALAGDLEMARRITASYKPAVGRVPGRASLARLFCGAARASHAVDASQAERSMEQCNALLDGIESDARTLDAELERVRTLTALGHYEDAAARALNVGGQDPLQMLISLTQPESRTSTKPRQLAATDAARIAAHARAQASALLHVASALTKQSRAAEAGLLIERAKTAASLEVQLGAADHGRADYTQALALSSSPEWSIGMVSGHVAASAQAASGMVKAGRTDEAFAILDGTLAKLQSDPLGSSGTNTNLVTTDEFWSMQRQQEFAIMELLVTAMELAIEAEREQLAVHYAEAALEHSKHSPPIDYVRVTSAVAPLDFKLGNRTRALELLAHAEQRIVQNLESDKHSAWYLEIARAYSRINEVGHAQQIWLREAARSRFGDLAGVIAALGVGLECLGRQGSSNELAQMTAMVEDVDRLALLS